MVAAATNGVAFDRLVVIFLKRMPWGIRAAKLRVLWPIKEIGDAGRISNGGPLLLTNGAGSSTCQSEKISCR